MPNFEVFEQVTPFISDSLKATNLDCLNFRAEYPLQSYISHCQINYLILIVSRFFIVCFGTRSLNYSFTYTLIEIV